MPASFALWCSFTSNDKFRIIRSVAIKPYAFCSEARAKEVILPPQDSKAKKGCVGGEIQILANFGKKYPNVVWLRFWFLTRGNVAPG
jgi:hypothetical protein